MTDTSIFEVRFYLGIVFIFIFGFFAVIMMLGGPTHPLFFVGLALLIIVIISGLIGFHTHKTKRCLHCGRLVFDPSYEFCPFCGENWSKSSSTG